MECDSISDITMPSEYSPVSWIHGVLCDKCAPECLVFQHPHGLLDDADISTLITNVGDLGGVIAFREPKMPCAKVLKSCPQRRQFLSENCHFESLDLMNITKKYHV